MLLIFESPDKTGKTTLAKMLSEVLDIPYIKLNNISIEEDIQIKDSVSIATHSQLETIIQLHEKGVIKDAILDRFHISEYVYSKLFSRTYDINYILDIDKDLNRFNDVLLIKSECYYAELKRRWKDKEKLLNRDNLNEIIKLYDEFYTKTVLPIIKIDSGTDITITFQTLLLELMKRGIYKNHVRPRRWQHDETMMEIAKTIAKRGSCLNRQVGAVLTEDGYVIGLGYNGPPSGLPHCETCLRRERNVPSGQQMEISRALHAEENAIMQSGIRNKSDKDLRIYCTDSPCKGCMAKLIQIGVKKIYYLSLYNDELALAMAEQAGIEMIKMD